MMDVITAQLNPTSNAQASQVSASKIPVETQIWAFMSNVMMGTKTQTMAVLTASKKLDGLALKTFAIQYAGMAS